MDESAGRTDLACLTVSGCQVPLRVFEALSFARTELHDALVDLQQRTGASQLGLLSTCERIELYAVGTRGADASALVRAVAGNRGLPCSVVARASSLLTGDHAARHLLRVTSGLESFVLGKSDILGQVRVSAEASRASGAGGLELERLMATAVNTSRRVHRQTSFGEGGGSVAAAAVRLAATHHGGDLRGRRVLVVGAGQVATEVAASAGRLGAAVTVCNRTRRHAERLAASGAAVVDLRQLLAVLSVADVAIFGTAAPNRLVDAVQLDGARSEKARDLLVVDLCVPRNVDPAVRELDGVRLVDLGDLRLAGAVESEAMTRDVAHAEQIVDAELERYLRWLAGRSAAVSVRRLRADIAAFEISQVEHATRGIPEDLRPLVEERVRGAVRRLAHGPTRRLLDAPDAGDDELVEVLAGIFAQ